MMWFQRYAQTNHHCAGGARAAIIILIAVVLVLGVAVPKLLRKDADQQAATPAPTSETGAGILGPLDPTPFRTEITALERIVYADELGDIPGGLAEVSRVATSMIQAVRGDGKDTHRNRTQMILYRFVRSVRESRSDTGYYREIENLQELWERVRNTAFLPAPWFRGMRDEAAAPAGPPERVADPAMIQQLLGFCDRLESLVSRGQREALAIGAGPGTEPRWGAWCTGWGQDLRPLQTSFPPRLGSHPAINLTMAHSELGVALQQLRQLASGGDKTSIQVPSYKEREGVFLSASWHTQQARDYLARLNR